MTVQGDVNHGGQRSRKALAFLMSGYRLAIQLGNPISPDDGDRASLSLIG